MLSALTARRSPIGFSGPWVVSLAVCCSVSLLISAPTRMMSEVSQSHSSRMTTPASAPYVSPYLPKLLT